MQKKLCFILLGMFFLPLFLHAQIKIGDDPLSYDDVVFNREFNLGLTMHTNGFGVTGHFVKIHSIFKKTVYEVELMDIKHPKEVRQQSIHSTSGTTARGFVFGKLNSFYNLNVGIGRVRSLAEKGRKGGVEVSFYYSGALSIGLAKPYHLDLIYDYGTGGTEIPSRSESYSEENANLFLDERFIKSASSFLVGWNKLKIHPGLKGKASVLFDWAAYNEFVKAIEVGVIVNVYPKRVPIMLTEDNQFIYPNLFLKLMIGKRWQ